ncbi:hypothetical protein H072_7959 [Dactylellina haptotyla CBS 200.50]|uniref:PHD-type domain-containing protein n=1 Tax=Dactylellina haptotyla (strain CBS 200.50) TaxID=1284197 RepID=S8BG13_DACHA|nr:hypothetical protein H072_7959 [Dactylellina haptotyla CBS 200.50]
MDTCIVCLADLPEKNLPRTGTDGRPISYNLDDLPEFLLARLPCSHILHNSCLKPWVERANSCPICRKAFNIVELVTSPTGEVLSSYCVDDKVQVSEHNDHNMLPTGTGENEENDRRQQGSAAYTPVCFICNESGYSDLLLFCDDCRSPYHTYCLGIETAPQGLWYCPPCVIERPILRSRVRNSNNSSSSSSARRGRARPNYDPWERVWLTVGGRYESLEVAYSANDDDEALEPNERDIDAWNRRIDVARRQGVADVLHEAVPRILERLPLVHQEPEMTEDEKTAWAMFEEAEGTLFDGATVNPMDQEEDKADSSAAASRKRRLSKLLTSSPRAERHNTGDDTEGAPPESPTQPAPERKLKRPRTRRVVPAPSANPESPTEAQPRKLSVDTIAGANSPPAPKEPAPSSPTLLDTLLADIDKPQTSSMAGLKFPRPISSNRPAFLPPSSPLTPPTDTPESSPASPILEAPHEVTLPHSPPAEPSSPPPRQDSASPSSLSLTNKKEIEKIVRSVLAPYYQAGDMSSEQFADINKSVSRSLYNKIGDGRIREWEKTKWQGLAKKEVDRQMDLLKGSTSA